MKVAAGYVPCLLALCALFSGCSTTRKVAGNVMRAVGVATIDSKSLDDRMTALGRLETDEDLLECVLFGHYDDVKLKAIGRMKADSTLWRVIEAKPRKHLTTEMKELASTLLKSDEYRGRVIAVPQISGETKRRLLEAIGDSTVLKGIPFAQHVERTYRQLAAMRCANRDSPFWDEELLMRYIQDSGLDAESVAAVARRLVTPKFCAEVLKRADIRGMVAMELLGRVREETLLMDVVRSPATDHEVRRRALLDVRDGRFLSDCTLDERLPVQLREVAAEQLVRTGADCRSAFLAVGDVGLQARLVAGVKDCSSPAVQSRLQECFRKLPVGELLRSVVMAMDGTIVFDDSEDQKKFAQTLLSFDSAELRRKTRSVIVNTDVLESLVQRACEASKDELALWAVGQARGDRSLERIARKTGKSDLVAAKVVSRVADEAVLQRMARNDSPDCVKLALVRRLTRLSRDVLRELADGDSRVIATQAQNRMRELSLLSREDEEKINMRNRIREEKAVLEDREKARKEIEGETAAALADAQIAKIHAWEQIRREYGLQDNRPFTFCGIVKAEASGPRLEVAGKRERVFVLLDNPEAGEFVPGASLTIRGLLVSDSNGVVRLSDVNVVKTGSGK